MSPRVSHQTLYRRAQLEAGKCARGCGRPRWGRRTTCQTCTLRCAELRRWTYREARAE
jgi:hypothetical protein